LDQVDKIVVAANTVAGLTEIINPNPHTGEQKRTILNK
tara:strand:- start:1 stop:114 length:114 start_codon:yes stop_codon:yes gene_type:complete